MRKLNFAMAAAAAVIALAALGPLSAPAAAGDFGVYGSYWDTKDAGQGYGGGIKVGWSIVELRATYFNDITANEPTILTPGQFDNGGRKFKIHAAPLEAGLKFNLAHDAPVIPYLGGGAAYYLLSTNRGKIKDEAGWYAVAGLDIPTHSAVSINVEGIYRGVKATVTDFENADLSDKADLKLDGFGVNAGVVWKF
jgi:outer membrane protein W